MAGRVRNRNEIYGWQHRLSAVLLLILFSSPLVASKTAPEHVVSLDMCTDWLLLKSRTDQSRVTYSPHLYRFAADWVPRGLAVHDGSLEHIIQLNPDLVISGRFNASLLRARLQQLDYRVEVLELPVSLHDLTAYLDHFNQLLNLSRTGQEPTYAHNAHGKRMLLLGANGIGTGRATLENDVLTAAGWSNYLHDNGYLSLELEQVVDNPPDVILQVGSSAPALANLFSAHPVLQQRSDMLQISAASWRWRCPGPWTYSLVQDLSRLGDGDDQRH